ncbi:MAG: hypothetical protein EXR01_01635 [Acetobacteraceae bacterium]|nr:hypothetical protein [Acetobacteraceae bacterium]
MQMATITELETGRSSQRTKTALTEAKQRDMKLGNLRLRDGDTAVARIEAVAGSAQSTVRAADVLTFIHQANFSVSEPGVWTQ